MNMNENEMQAIDARMATIGATTTERDAALKQFSKLHPTLVPTPGIIQGMIETSRRNVEQLAALERLAARDARTRGIRPTQSQLDAREDRREEREGH